METDDKGKLSAHDAARSAFGDEPGGGAVPDNKAGGKVDIPPADAGKPGAQDQGKENDTGNHGDQIDLSIVDLPDGFGEQAGRPAAAKPGTVPEDEPAEIKHADNKTRETFAQMRTRLKQVEEENARLKEARPAGDPGQVQNLAQQMARMKAQHDALQTKLNEAYDQLGRYSLEADPRFRAKYEGQQKATIASIKRVAREWDIKDELIDECLKASPRRRVQILAEAAPDAGATLNPYFAQFDHLEEMKRMDLENHRQTLDGLVSENNQKAQAAQIALTQSAIAKAIQEGHPLFRKVDGNENWNKLVENVHATIRATITSNNPARQIESIVRGAAAPVYLAPLSKERAMRRKLENELNQRNKARARVDGNMDPGGDAPKAPDTMTAKDAAQAVFKD